MADSSVQITLDPEEEPFSSDTDVSDESFLLNITVSSEQDNHDSPHEITILSSDEEFSPPNEKRSYILSNEENFPSNDIVRSTGLDLFQSSSRVKCERASASESCFFEDDPNIPIHSLSSSGILAEEVVTLLFEAKENVIATKQPLHCMQTASFIVNCDKLSHHSDIRMDDLGCWVNTGVDRLCLNVSFTDDGKVLLVTKLNCRPAVLRKSIYCLTRSYWKHKQNSSFCRQLHQLTDWNDKKYPLVYLRYIVKGGGSVDIQPVPHGNTKGKGTPYYRTKESAKRRIIETAKSLKGREAFNKLFNEAGGVNSCQSVGDAPRNLKQITNTRYKLSDPQAHKDSLFEVMKECMQGQSRSDLFIRSVQAAPEATCVLASDYQLNDLDRFCTNPSQFSILGIDPTFNLGEFALTVTTYRHLMMTSRRNGQAAIMIGPMFAHQKKESNTYHAFASSLVGLKPALQGIQCIGTDGEIALSNGFQLAMPCSKHVLCFIHSKRNIKRKLIELGIGESYVKEYMSEMFGVQTGTHLTCGLLDCSSEEEFDSMLKNLENVWNKREEEARKTTSPAFFEWFLRYHALNFKTKMLLPLRKSIGLGRDEYTTNDNECINSIIKKKVDFKASELSDFCEKMRQLVEQQKEDIQQAFVMDSGPYRVREEFNCLTKTSSQWTKLTKVPREKHLRLIHSYKFEPYANYLEQLDSSSYIETEVECEKENLKELSVSLTECGLSPNIFGGIWRKASEILSKSEDAIVDSPGSNNVKICISYSSTRPHILTIFGSGKVTCDCRNNESLTLCAHSVAVAEKFGLLKKLLDWYQSSNRSINMWKLSRSSTTTPQNPGAKPNQRNRKSKNKLPVLTTSNYIPPSMATTTESITNISTPPGSIPSYQNNFPASARNQFPMHNQSPMSTYHPWYQQPFPSIPQCMPVTNQYYNMPMYQPYAPPPAICHNSNPFIVTLRSGNISKCASCSGFFPKDQQTVVIKHVEKDMYTKDGETRVGGDRPRYYHATLDCLLFRHPYFTHDLLLVDPELFESLIQVNKELVNALNS